MELHAHAAPGRHAGVFARAGCLVERQEGLVGAVRPQRPSSHDSGGQTGQGTWGSEAPSSCMSFLSNVPPKAKTGVWSQPNRKKP